MKHTTTSTTCSRTTCERAQLKGSDLCHAHAEQERRLGLRGYIDPTPARRHIETLVAAGWSGADIAKVSGVSEASITGHRQGSQRRIKAQTARAILAIKPTDPLPVVPQVGCDGLGFHRRVQALACLGWRYQDLADRLGCKPQTIADAMCSNRVGRVLHESMLSVYQELQGSWGSSKRTATRARNRGWVPPAGWDDIDTDPEPQHPDGDEPEVVDEVAIRRVISGHGDPAMLTRAERKAAVRLLVSKGTPVGRAADMLRMSYDTAKKAVAA